MTWLFWVPAGAVVVFGVWCFGLVWRENRRRRLHWRKLR
jgi:hypothetical protein